jgi:hypothetical protein
MKMKRCLGILALFLAALAVRAFSQAVSQPVSHEEEVVRSAYATLSFLCGLKPVTKAALAQIHQDYVGKKKLDQDVADATPVYELSDFHVGTIASVANVRWNDLISVPALGPILDGSSASDGYHWTGSGPQDPDWNAEWHEMTVHWGTDTRYTPERIAMDQKFTVGEAAKLGSRELTVPATYSRYAAFTVRVQFQGKSLGPYHALFLFGRGEQGQEVVAPQDAIGASEQLLWYALEETAYPSDLLKSKLREQPLLARWIQDNRMPMDRCSRVRADLCCADGKCGLPEASVTRDLAVHLPLHP